MSNSVFQQNVDRIKFAVFLMVLRFTRRATSSIADCYALEAGAATVSPSRPFQDFRPSSRVTAGLTHIRCVVGRTAVCGGRRSAFEGTPSDEKAKIETA